MALYTAQEIGKEIGIGATAVLKRARNLKIVPAEKVLNKYYFFSEDQKETIKFLGSKIVRIEKNHEIEIIYVTREVHYFESQSNHYTPEKIEQIMREFGN